LDTEKSDENLIRADENKNMSLTKKVKLLPMKYPFLSGSYQI
jgi:hypothetical protein